MVLLCFLIKKENNQYYKARINGVYKTKILNRPLVLTANVFGDRWSEGFERLYGSLSALSILKASSKSMIGVGLHTTYLYNNISILPLIAYTSNFNSSLRLDILLPNKVSI